MSKFVMCVIRDSAADGYGVPVFFKTLGVATRSFTDEVNRAAEDNPLYKYPQDHDLWLLGSYDAETAEFDIGPPRQLARGRDVAIKEVPDAKAEKALKAV